MSDTPRTKAATRMAFAYEQMVPVDEAQKLERELAQSKEANAGLMRACDYLERQLDDAKETIAMLEIRHGATMLCHEAQMDEVTKQRDALAQAMNEMWLFIEEDDHPNCNTPAFNAAIVKYKAALAAVKGGGDD